MFNLDEAKRICDAADKGPCVTDEFGAYALTALPEAIKLLERAQSIIARTVASCNCIDDSAACVMCEARELLKELGDEV